MSSRSSELARARNDSGRRVGRCGKAQGELRNRLRAAQKAAAPVAGSVPRNILPCPRLSARDTVVGAASFELRVYAVRWRRTKRPRPPDSVQPRMRGGAGADSRLPGARRVALLLFICSVVLPTVVVLRRGGGAYFSSDGSDDGALDDFELDLGSTTRQQQVPAQRKRAAGTPGVEGTRVLVFVAREQGNAVELHVRADPAGVADVCSGVTLANEAYLAAAERILFACASLGPPPDVEFLERAGEPAPGAPVPFVALVRTERLLRGSTKTPQVRSLLFALLLRSRSHAFSQNGLAFRPLQQVLDDNAAGSSFAPGVADALPAAAAYLAPWVATAGKKAGACGPPPAATAVS